MNKPLKRHEALKPLSRDHHHGLLLCWKIREGRKKDIDPERIKAYTDYFYCSQLIPHFDFEEKEVFPLLGEQHPMIQRAVTDHKRLSSLFRDEKNVERSLKTIEKELENHIRFEERVLFHEIQQKASEGDLQKIDKKEQEILTPDPDEWDDKFWIKDAD